ncbi:bifunctional preprotein translocase subunit SecD/SecF [uncultured Blautia sp.]|uniref:protein translocase subunit SecD n=1 Tax=Blautia TaxID=572511 RepID=UPI0008228DB6|nr:MULTISPECIES: protein translocase subunit SecD [Blautia]MCU6774237.1 protein translocase subunit SecD [Blautia acetigignens]NSL02767.1 protein translocase subunit SecD [Blautia glucerasea]SCH34208.1 bifunctional preprotein translocase subunit SecD/SecF [uncultured Blautia sp.]
MKKSRGILVLILTAIITVFCCFTAAVGIGPTGTGAAKNIKTGLDLAGGVSITYQAKDSDPSSEDMKDTVYKLQKRVEQYSTEAQVYQEGSDRINVEIPGVTDANAILEELGQPGSLCFITQQDEDGNANFQTDANSETGYSLARSLDEIREAGCVVLEGTDVADATGGAIQQQNSSSREYVVDLTLTDEGKTKFAEATQNNVGKQIAIIYDNGVLSAPRVNEAITGGKAQISGMESVERAQELASYIRIGSLSLELTELRSSVVAAQLGEEAISTSLIAGMIGLIIVILFMIIAYRVPGAVAGLSLIFYTATILLTLNAFDITLTLPGIAGIILGIGMAVDANVIIYARIREEIGAGSTVRAAIKAGFSKAFSAIFDGNITTLIAAFVLMWLGTGSVKGFAYTLALGIVVSMFTALVFSRLVINALYAVGVRDEKFYGKTEEKKVINFVGKRKFCFTLSIILILAGPAVMLIHSTTGGKALNYSLEFSGGTSTNVTFNEDLDIKTIDSEVTPVVEEVTGDKNVQPTKVVGTKQVIIKTRALTLDEREALNKALVDKFDVDESLIQAESISATVSNEMRRDAVVAVIVATIFMLLYIWFRFKDIRFAGSAVLALLHDVLVVLTFYAISRISVGNTFIACMLTIVGYSINATIVIFDRIRENLHGSKRLDEIEEVVNRSITQTLTRSIYTSLTTFIMVAVLYIMGVSSIREFAAPLMVGIICGAYSSVCITGALWLVMKKKIGAGQDTVKAAAAAAPAKKTAQSANTQSAPASNAQAQPKKKNRKRVQERLAAQEAAKNAENSSSEENK